MNGSIYIRTGLVLLVVFIMGGVGFWWIQNRQAPAQQDSQDVAVQKTNYERLVVESNDFAQAEELQKKGEAVAAEEKYKIVLSQTENPIQSGMVKFRIALAQSQKGDYMAGIPLFKEIIVDPDAGLTTRADAVQELALMYYTYFDARITDEIFKSPPFAAMRVSGDVDLSYRHLLEYGISIRPTSISDFMLANWYAREILRQPKESQNSATVIGYKEKLTAYIQDGESHIEELRTRPTEQYYLSAALFWRAVVLGKATRIGISSLVDPETAYEQLYDTIKIMNNDGYLTSARLQHATYLARKYGSARSADIKTILAEVYNNKSTSMSTEYAVAGLKSLRAVSGGAKADLVLLASIDPKFKEYLISLGWQTGDFTKQ